MHDESDSFVTRPSRPPDEEPTAVTPPAPDEPTRATSDDRAAILSQPAFGDPAGVLSPPDSLDQRPEPVSVFKRAGRRATLFAAVAVLIVGAAFGGVAAGHAIWAPDEQRTVQEYAPELPARDQQPYNEPSDDGSRYGPYDGSASGSSSGSDSTTAAGPSAAEISSLVEEVSPGVVNINVTGAYSGGQGAGTGMVLTSSGLVLTNNHVIEGSGEIIVTSVGSGKTYSATVLGYDASSDIALLQLEDASGLDTVTLGDSSSLTIGQKIVVIGNAGGDGGEPTASGGSVTALDQQIVASGSSGAEELTGLIKVNANVRAGQSGGPTVNTDGDVIGVITAASTGYSLGHSGGDGYAVPIDKAISIVEQIQAGESTGSVHVGPTAFLGVQVTSSLDERAMGPGYGRGYDDDGSGTRSGALVAGVLSNTPAAEAGLRSGDTITAIDGRDVDSASSLSGMLGGYVPGDDITVVWIDQSGEQHTATVTLIKGPPA